MNDLRDNLNPEIRKLLEEKEKEFDVEIATKSEDVDIIELKAEFEDIKLQFKELVMSYLKSDKTDQETRDFLMEDQRVKNLMESVPEYNIICFKSSIIKDKGMVFDDNYQ